MPTCSEDPPESPRHPYPSVKPTAGANRRIGIAVDLSDESVYAIEWAVQNYLRPGDAVVLLHVATTSVLYGADWGSVDLNLAEETDEESQQKLEDDFDAFTATKANDLARPLAAAAIPFKIHLVKDHDMKERLCLEVERLGLSAVIMGSKGFGSASRRSNDKGRLGSVSDYCVHHCVCPVVVVRYPVERDGGSVEVKGRVESNGDAEYHDASDNKQTGHDWSSHCKPSIGILFKGSISLVLTWLADYKDLLTHEFAVLNLLNLQLKID